MMRKNFVLFLLFLFSNHALCGQYLDLFDKFHDDYPLIAEIMLAPLLAIGGVVILISGFFIFDMVIDVVNQYILILLFSLCQNPQTFINFLDKKNRFLKTYTIEIENLAKKAIEKNNIPMFLALIKKYDLGTTIFLVDSILFNNVELFKSLFEDKDVWYYLESVKHILYTDRPEMIRLILEKPQSPLFKASIIGGKNNITKTILPFLESQWISNQQLISQFLNIFSKKSKAKIRIWFYTKTEGKEEISKFIADHFKIDLSSAEVLKYILFLICNTDKEKFNPIIKKLAEKIINSTNILINAPLDFSKKRMLCKHTALHLAIYKRNNDLLKLLAQHPDIDPHIENSSSFSNRTAFDIAIELGDISCIKLVMGTKRFNIFPLKKKQSRSLCTIYQLLKYDSNQFKELLSILNLTYDQKIKLIKNELNSATCATFTDAELSHNEYLFLSLASYIQFCTNWHSELTISEYYKEPLDIAQKHYQNVQESCDTTSAQYIAKEKIYHIFLRISPKPAADRFIAHILNRKGLPADIIKLILKLNCKNNINRYIAHYADRVPDYYKEKALKKNEIIEGYKAQRYKQIEAM